MGTIYTFKNGSKLESGNNTMTYDNVEVPETLNAKRVFVVRVELDTSMPQYVAAADTYAEANALIGKLAPSSCQISEPGAITSKRVIAKSTGAAQFAIVHEGPEQAQGRWEIPKAPADGKYYVTVGVKGTACTGQMTVHYRFDFEIEN